MPKAEALWIQDLPQLVEASHQLRQRQQELATHFQVGQQQVLEV
jgi:hypothetical protein